MILLKKEKPTPVPKKRKKKVVDTNEVPDDDNDDSNKKMAKGNDSEPVPKGNPFEFILDEAEETEVDVEEDKNENEGGYIPLACEASCFNSEFSQLLYRLLRIRIDQSNLNVRFMDIYSLFNLLVPTGKKEKLEFHLHFEYGLAENNRKVQFWTSSFQHDNLDGGTLFKSHFLPFSNNILESRQIFTVAKTIGGSMKNTESLNYFMNKDHAKVELMFRILSTLKTKKCFNIKRKWIEKLEWEEFHPVFFGSSSVLNKKTCPDFIIKKQHEKGYFDYAKIWILGKNDEYFVSFKFIDRNEWNNLNN